jgi:hypothetical protein
VFDENTEDVVLTLVPNGSEYDIGAAESATVNIFDSGASTGPNLTVFLGDAAIPLLLTKGGKVHLSGQINNIGDAPTGGAIRIAFFLLPVGQSTPGVGDAPFATGDVDSPIEALGVRNFDLEGDLPADAEPGTYGIVALIDSDGVVAETNENDNTDVVSPRDVVALATFAPGAAFVAADGTRFSLRGSGSGSVAPGAAGEPPSIVIDTGSGTASLSVRPPRGSTSSIFDLTVTGVLTAASMPGVDIDGSVLVEGVLGSLTAGAIRDHHLISITGPDPSGAATFKLKATEVENLSIDSAIPIKSIKVASWKDTDATPDAITAPWVGSIRSAGDFAAAITVSDATQKNSLGKLTAKGVLSSLIRSAGSIGSVTAGRLVHAQIFAAVDDGVTGLPDAADDFADGSAAKIGRVTAKGIEGGGASFVASVIAAPSVGKVSLKDVQVDNAGAAFGVAADSAIARVARTGAAAVKALDDSSENRADLDFILRLV